MYSLINRCCIPFVSLPVDGTLTGVDLDGKSTRYRNYCTVSPRELTGNLFCDKKEAAWILFGILSNRALLIEAGGYGV